ncbi:MAG: hypothetical protein Q9223_005611 [Gallowayella weberi]
MRFIAGVKLMRTEDLMFALVDLYLWTVAELSSGIICGCFPTVPQFVYYVSNLGYLSQRRLKSQRDGSALPPGRTPRPPIRKRSTFYCAGLKDLKLGMASKTSQNSTIRPLAPSTETFIASVNAASWGNETNRDIYERHGGSLSRHGSKGEAGSPIDSSPRSRGELERGTTGAESQHRIPLAVSKLAPMTGIGPAD